MIKGIGQVYAKKIVNLFEEKTLDIIEEESNHLIEIEGIGKKRIEMIKYNEIQKKVLHQAGLSKIMLLTGINGTGKLLIAFGNGDGTYTLSVKTEKAILLRNEGALW